MSRWGELIPHREDDDGCLCGCRDESETCDVYWGASGCDLPPGHDSQRAVRPHQRKRDGVTVTIFTAFLYGKDLTAEELRLRNELYGEGQP